MTEEATKSPKLLIALLGALILGATLSAFSGVPQYDAAHLAIGTFVALLLTVAWAVGAWKAKNVLAGRFRAPLLLLGAFTGYVAAGAVFTGLGPEAADTVARWTLPLIAAVVIGAAPRSSAMPAWATRFAAISALAVVVVVLLQATGVMFPEAIPHAERGARGYLGPFDARHSLATFGVLAACVSATGVSMHSGSWRVVTIAGAVAGAFAAGAGGVAGAVLALVVAAVLAGAAQLKRPREDRGPVAATWVAAAVVGAISLASLGAHVADDAVEEEISTQTFRYLYLGDEPVYDTPETITHYRTAALSFATAGLPLGDGPGSYFRMGSRHQPFDSEVALAAPGEVDTGRFAFLPAAQIVGEFGLGALFLLGALLACVVAASRRLRDEPEVAVAAPGVLGAIAAIVVLAGTLPGLLTPASLVLLGCLVGIAAAGLGATTHEGPDKARRAERLVFVVAPLVILVALTGYGQFKSLRAGLEIARANVFLAAGYIEEGRAALEKAESIQQRFGALFNLGLVVAYTPSDEPEGERAIRLLANAHRARPGAAVPLAILGRQYRSAVMDEQVSPAESESLNRATDMLSRAIELDPNLHSAALDLAQVHLARTQIDEAVEVLEAVAERELTGEGMHRVYGELAELYDYHLEQPILARDMYERARDAAPNASTAEQYDIRVLDMEYWIDNGIRRRTSRPRHEHGDGDVNPYDLLDDVSPQDEPSQYVPPSEREGSGQHDHDDHGHDDHGHEH